MEASQYGYEPNFTLSHSIILDHPIAHVFPVIGTSDGLERVTRLSGLCSAFALLQADTVAIPASVSLDDTHVRTASPSDGSISDSTLRNLPRQFFTLTETVPVLFGLVHTRVSLAGTVTYDEEAKLGLYETETTSGFSIKIWKLRRFEEVQGNRTRISETIRGRCPSWLRTTIQKQASVAHIAHMELYNTLF